MKVRFWQLVAVCAMGICWGWLERAASAQLPLVMPTPQVMATVHQNSRLSIDLNSPAVNYRSNGEWLGRLILPSQPEINQFSLTEPTDWVWIEIAGAPATSKQLIGKTVRLKWQAGSTIEADVRQVTTDINFTPQTIASQGQGNIHPQRLNGTRVGALQSLAGARSIDDILVRLTGVDLTSESGETPILTIDREPIQITGKFTGLVKILGTDPSQTSILPATCRGVKPCPNEYFRVQHYQLATHSFGGQI